MTLTNDTPPAAPNPYAIRAVDRVLDILDLLQGTDGGVTLVELSKVIGLPKSSAFRYLATLEARGYVTREAGDTYRLGLAFRPLRPRDLSLLTSIARPRMEELCHRFEETINLGVLDGHRVAYLDMVESPRAIRFAARPGHRDPVHSSALGKALTARLSVEEVRRVLAVDGMPRFTERTITTPERYVEELALVRERGYALDNAENEDGGRCVGVPLPEPLPAAISLSAPADRFPSERVAEVAAALRRSAEEIGAEYQRASRNG
ncbi:IclR family transcriptional regulator [Conexibacter woesei]|uniref:Glycerol operon regulatory protein n=1 Tax=Conexibacter woesei (strain DSM 14684 / CCUG 47730 / CIP 108061 / JCM 11494 / NBRC 100937 / ID131577) TaxID=469383 RepID=D3FEK4_CONWI|nr:IclR family transcriptional regulator [Conexibacter woesei]ADB49678.1 transcriptional regulator, IclR family [Conexibacter woesei DSM 14684]